MTHGPAQRSEDVDVVRGVELVLVAVVDPDGRVRPLVKLLARVPRQAALKLKETCGERL